MAEHVCPVWVGHLLASPIRKIFQNPDVIVGQYIAQGDTVVDVGAAMGFFSVPMARMVGEGGKVVCVDLQEKMLDKLRARAGKAGVEARIETRRCDTESLGLDDMAGRVDFALAFYVVHEAGPVGVKMREVYRALRDGGLFLVAEPVMHVSREGFEESVEAALAAGFEEVSRPSMRRSRAVLLRK